MDSQRADVAFVTAHAGGELNIAQRDRCALGLADTGLQQQLQVGAIADFVQHRGHQPLVLDLRLLPETFTAPEEVAAAYRPLAPYAAEDELRHWMLGGLTQKSDGRWTWRYDPNFRVPARFSALAGS